MVYLTTTLADNVTCNITTLANNFVYNTTSAADVTCIIITLFHTDACNIIIMFIIMSV